MFRTTMAAVAAAGALFSAGQATAAVLFVEASGLFDGTDRADALGLGAGEVLDVAWSVTFTWDLDRALRQMEGEVDVARGGAADSRPTLAVAQITLGGKSFTMPAAQFGAAIQGPAVINFQFINFGPNLRLTADLAPDSLAADLTQPPPGNFCATAACGGVLALNEDLFGTLEITNFTVVYDADTIIPGGVPEPSTWTLAILGFGLAGATLRRRREALA